MKRYTVILLIIISSCAGDGGHDKARTLVSGYFENGSDHKGYKIVSINSLDSSFCRDYDRLLGEKYVAMANALSRKADSLMKGTCYNANVKASDQASELLKESTRYLGKNDSLIAGAKSVFCGFQMICTAESDGEKQDFLFRFNTGISKIMDIEKLSADVNH